MFWGAMSIYSNVDLCCKWRSAMRYIATVLRVQFCRRACVLPWYYEKCSSWTNVQETSWSCNERSGEGTFQHRKVNVGHCFSSSTKIKICWILHNTLIVPTTTAVRVVTSSSSSAASTPSHIIDPTTSESNPMSCSTACTPTCSCSV